MSDEFIDLMEVKSLMESAGSALDTAAAVHWRRLVSGERLTDEQAAVSLTVAGVDLRRRGLLGSLPVDGQPAARQTAAGLLLKAADGESGAVRRWIARAGADDNLRHWREELRRIAQDLGCVTEAAPPPAPDDKADGNAVDLASILDDSAGKVLQIAEDTSKSLDERMRLIALAKPEAVFWKASRWAELLKVSDSRIRQQPIWKEWRAKERKKD